MTTPVLPGDEASLRRVAAILRQGGIAAIPTETVYGLAADALNPQACRAIFRAKRRPLADPLIVHVTGLRAADRCGVLGEEARRLARRFWPGPLTLVVPKRDCIDAIVTGGLATVALRAPAHPLTRRLLRLCGTPLAAPSANPFGYISPTTAQHVADSLGGRIAAILDGGPCRIGVESTIVDLSVPGRPRLLRPGGLPAERIEEALGRRLLRPSRRAQARPAAPGCMARHYSPDTPLALCSRGRLEAMLRRAPPHSTALVFLARPPAVPPAWSGKVAWLSPRGELAAAARNLYRVLRDMDGAGWKRIWAEQLLSDEDLGRALRDRLARAASRG